ncbi:NnrS family protein [Oligella urethralis]|uniref:NnrS family protein n=1 Tax=Oligella urethralis TaxID=90245 RepID=UPI000DF890AA|nr:NnrS family protein [Oligella urethralis]SUA57255.1 NnrS protein [Oligella urethralis]
MLQIHAPGPKPSAPHPILNMGFRIFFASSALFAIITMFLWIFVFTGKLSLAAQIFHPFYWHAHEMFYGYTMAIVAGFLLTAVQTWTGVTMPYGYRLLGIFAPWAVARCLWAVVAFNPGQAISYSMMVIAFIADMSFMILMCYTVVRAVLKVKQKRQAGIVAKILLLTLSNALCYLAIFNGNIELMRIGIYLGFYLLIALVLTVGRRVTPFFIQKGLSYDNPTIELSIRNSKTLDSLSLVFFLAFMIFDIFFPNPILVSVSAIATAVVNLIRLRGWYHPAIWTKPLLWSLFLGFIGMCIGLVLYALHYLFHLGTHSIAVHGLALSGIGMITIAMISRVSLGHTGRNIHQPPKTVPWLFMLMVIAFLARVILPLFSMDHYIMWIMIAQTAWIISFALFCVSYIPILCKNRVDGLFG